MKNITFLKKMAIVMLAIMPFVNGRSQVFKGVTDSLFQPLHRGFPSIGDINNDGKNDIYYGGETWMAPIAWQVQGMLYLNNGGLSFTGKASNLHTENYLTNGTFDANGLPPSVWGYSRFFDYNNDGNLDFILCSQSSDDLQIESSPNNRFCWLYTNGGSATNYTFTKVSEDFFPQAVDEDGNSNQNSSNISIGDYDKDGYNDVLIIGDLAYADGDNTSSRRYVELYKNMGNGTFQLQKVANPIPYESNPYPLGLFDIDDNLNVTPTKEFKPLSNGAVKFVDLNGDGWLDIISIGYMDDSNSGNCALYIYKNNQDGTFDEVKLSGGNFTGVYEGDITVGDYNNDGFLDFAVFGTPANGGTKRGDIYYNNGTGDFSFTKSEVETGNGLYGFSAAVVKSVDINGDGLTDFIGTGWTNVDNKGWGTYVFLQQADHSFVSQSNVGIPNLGNNAGGFTLGDIDGNNSIDAFATFYDGACEAKVYLNTYENTAPEAPTNVAATIKNGQATVTWDAGSDNEADVLALSYNIYVKNLSTGKIFSLIPADITTGHIKTVTDIQVAVHSDKESLSYSMALPVGEYEIGVQTIDPSFASSTFAKTTLSVTTNISKNSIASITAKSVDGGFLVTAPNANPVQIFDISGKLIAQGAANTVIPVTVQGVYIVKINNKVFKLSK